MALLTVYEKEREREREYKRKREREYKRERERERERGRERASAAFPPQFRGEFRENPTRPNIATNFY